MIARLRGSDDAVPLTGKVAERLHVVSPDLYRVKFEVNNLKPFSGLAFPFRLSCKTNQNSLVLVTNW